MSHEISKEKEISNENAQNQINLSDKAQTNLILKKLKKEKNSLKKASKKPFNDNKKIVPLLKPPSKRRKFNTKEKETNQENSQISGIIWDNKTIDEQYLERKLHPRIKIDEPKTPYPDGDDEDIYQEGINKVNEIKLTEELLNNVVAALNEKENDRKENKTNTNELKKRAYSNEYTTALKFYHENKEKYDDLSGERKICLENTLINKFHKEVRRLSKGKDIENNYRVSEIIIPDN